MRKRTLALIPALVLSALVAPASAVAESDQATFPEYTAMVNAYLRDYPGISADRARTAVLTQGNRVRMLEELGRNDAADFGASWYDPRTNKEHVRVTSDAGAAIVRALAASHGVDVEVGRAQYRLRDLYALAEQINARRTPDVLDERSVFAVADSTINRVKVIAQTRSRADEARARYANDKRVTVGQPTETVRHSACTSRNSCGSPFRSGISVGPDMDASGSGSATNYCSAGFTASSTDGAKWLVTAGHCNGDFPDDGVVSFCGDGSSGGCWGHGEQYWGAMRDSWPPGEVAYANVDVARARKDNSYWSAGGYIYNAGTPSSPFDVEVAIELRSTIQVGDTVCQSTRLAVTGAYCGTVQDVASTDFHGMVKATPHDCPGDSGGGWYMYTGGQRWAAGIHSAGSPGCHTANGYSYFSALPDIVSYWDWSSTLTIRFEYR